MVFTTLGANFVLLFLSKYAQCLHEPICAYYSFQSVLGLLRIAARPRWVSIDYDRSPLLVRFQLSAITLAFQLIPAIKDGNRSAVEAQNKISVMHAGGREKSPR